MSTYPRRDSHFAHRAFRIMHKSCAAAEMGCNAFALVAVIMHTEDAARYSGPVRFWPSQLQETLGFGKWDTLDRARRAAIEAGWLYYEGRGRKAPGLYWATIPEQYECLDDSPLERPATVHQGGAGEGNGQSLTPAGGCNPGGKQSGVTPAGGCMRGYNPGVKGGITRVQAGCEGGDLSYPYPNPKPSPKDTGSEPLLAEASDPPQGEFALSNEQSPKVESMTPYQFPVVGGSGQWILSQAKFDEYVAAYPHLDIDAEMRAAVQWCRDNPSRRKTARGMTAHLNYRLQRSQNQNAMRAGASPNGNAAKRTVRRLAK